MWNDIEPGYTSRCVAAEVRARLAAERLSGVKFAAKIGMSQNYFATRLREEKPFTIDDVERICQFFDIEPGPFVERAMSLHGDYADDAMRKAEQSLNNVTELRPRKTSEVPRTVSDKAVAKRRKDRGENKDEQ